MSRETISIPTSGENAFIGAAGVFAVLAYPTELKDRDDLVTAIKAWHIRRFPVKDRNNFIPKLREYPTRAIYKTGPITNAIKRIVNRRIPAAKMSLLVVLGQSINEITNHLASNFKGNEDSLEKRSKNIRNRVWIESKSVLHFSVALHMMLEVDAESECRYHTSDGAVDFFALIEHTEWLEPTLVHAEKIRRILINHPKAHISEQDTIRLVPE